MTGHFNGRRLMGSNGAIGSLMAGFQEPQGVGIAAVVAIPESQLALDRDTGFRPGVDNWEFYVDETVLTDEVFLGSALTSAWYFAAKKASNGPLWRKYQEAEGVMESNRRGYRWASVVVKSAYEELWEGLQAVAAEVVAQGGPNPVARLSLASFHAIRAGFAANPGIPQIAYLYTSNPALPGQAVLIYRSNGQQLFAVDPGHLNQSITIDFTSGAMTPLSVAGTPAPFVAMIGSGFALLGSADAIEDHWDAVADGTVGDEEFPEYRLMVGWGMGAGETTPLDGTVVHVYGEDGWPVVYAECVSCHGENRGPSLPPGNAPLANLGVYLANAGGGWSFASTTHGLIIGLATPGDRRVGLEIMSRPEGESEFFWTDWSSLTMRRLAANIAPAEPTIEANADLTLTLNLTNAPANLEYEWDFDDGTARPVTTTPQTTHTWATDGSYLTTVTARNRTTKQPVAKAKVTVEVRPRLNVWLLTSLTITHERSPGMLPGIEGSSSERNMYFGDSVRLTRARDGLQPVAILLLEQETNRGCTGCGAATLPEGLFMLEGNTISRSTLTAPFVYIGKNPSFITVPPAPAVFGWLMVRPLPDPDPFNTCDGQSYNRTGNGEAGRIIATYVRYCTAGGQRHGNAMTVDATIAGDTMTGTLTIIMQYEPQFVTGGGTRTLRVTFTATRVP